MTDAGQAKPSSRSDSDVNTLLIKDLRGSAPKLATCRDAADLIERLRGVEADARRYRWLRQCSPIRSDRTMYVQAGEYVKGVFQRTIYPSGAELDEAIDAAIAASRSTGAADVGEDHG